MTVETLLQRLDKVRRSGKDKWSARCPAHEDKGPSLAVRETDDGRILIHCFAGCGAAEVLSALGMEFSDLFPKSDGHHTAPVRKPWNASDVLKALALEVLVAWNFAKVMANGDPLSESDLERLKVCAGRLLKGSEACNG